MRSGAAFSAIFLIWIAGFVLAIYTLYPDIEKSIKTAESIDTSAVSELIDDGNKDAIGYTPLGVFDLLKN